MTSNYHLLSFLGHGGNFWQYYARFNPDRYFQWFKTGIVKEVPKWDEVYFQVNPSLKSLGEHKRGEEENVAAINCLFAEFDGKDFSGETVKSETWATYPLEVREEANKKALEHIHNLEVKPSVIVFSGGGYHCYWFLKETKIINNENLEEIRHTQNAWVEYVQGDKGAKDLARVLRVPSSYNNKYSPPVQVEIIEEDFDLLYSFDFLAKKVNTGSRKNTTKNSPKYEINNPVDYKDIEKALNNLDNWRVDEYYSWLEVGMMLHSQGDEYLQMWDEWSKKSKKYQSGECQKRWDTFKEDRQKVKTIKTLFFWSYEDCPTGSPMPEFDDAIPEYRESINFDIPDGFVINASSGSTVNVYSGKDKSEGFERFKLGKASDAFLPRPNIDWIIQNMVKTNSLNIWYGEYGHKKTFVALSAAVCVASGTKWLGQNTKQSNVLIIDEESGEHTLLDRLQAAIIGESQEEDLPIYFLSLSGFNFMKNENDIVFLKEYIKSTESKLVIIDSFADVMSGGDENAVKDNVPVLIKLRKVCEETGAGIILLHHANANGGIRGSTSIGASLNSALKIQSEPKSTKIEITTKKMRDTEAFTKNAEIIFHNIPDKYGNKQLIDFYITEGEPVQFWEDESNTWENEIVEYMKSNNDEMITKDFLTTVSKDKHASYNKAIYSLRGKGIIQKSDKSTSRLAVWELLNEQ